MQNTLYYGDNLDILRRYVADESVDLVYLDPPFNSNANYNVLFAEKDGTQAAGQIQAFSDTWTWNQESEKTFAELVTAGGKVADCMQAFRTFLGPCDLLAYLVMMTPRLVELRRTMRATASIYLHCDDVASHYLKLLMDAVFGPGSFRVQIVWKRTFAHGNVSRNYGCVSDLLLFYSKAADHTWNQPYRTLSAEQIEAKYPNVDPDGRRWQSVTLRNPGVRPNLHFPYTASNGVTYQPHPNGWSCNEERLRKYDRDGHLHYPTKPTGALRLRMYADDSLGERLQNIWDDIPPIGAQAAERLGYPTQKPVALLERIVQASSNPGDVVLDPFCGCGTTVAAAQKLGRQWIGIDVTHLAITLMKQRLKDAYGIEPVTRKAPAKPAAAPAESAPVAAEGPGGYVVPAGFRVVGEPVSLPDAEALAAADPYQFQWWALGLVGARPVEQKKGADKGIDGKIVFQGDAPGKFETVILSVKAGHTMRAHVHELRGVLDREKAVIGILITMQEATGPMREEAVTAGFWHSGLWNKDYPRIQLLTVGDLLDGRQIEMPPQKQVSQTFRRAAKVKAAPSHTQPGLFDQEAEGEG